MNQILAVTINLQDKQIKPTTEVQIVTADSNYSGLDKVIVEAVDGISINDFENYLNHTIKLDIDFKNTTELQDFSCAYTNLRKVSGNLIVLNSYAFYRSSIEEVDFPECLNNKDSIESVFYNCKSLVKVNLPKVSRLGVNTFRECSSLKEVNMPLVEYFGYYSFSNCTSLEHLNLPSAGAFGEYCFNGCSSLKELDLNGKNIRFNNRYLFYNCSSLETINATIIGISQACFSGCSSLKQVNLSNITEIPASAFGGCIKLNNLDLESVTNIGTRAFSGCSSLTSVSIPKVTSIGDYAFNNCSSCELFDFRQSIQVPTLSSTSVFTNTPSTKKIVVPDELYDTWITATNWSSSTNNIVSSIIKASDYEASL